MLSLPFHFFFKDNLEKATTSRPLLTILLDFGLLLIVCLVVIITVTISKCCCYHFISFIDIVVKANEG
jgi:hypothetical protein